MFFIMFRHNRIYLLSLSLRELFLKTAGGRGKYIHVIEQITEGIFPFKRDFGVLVYSAIMFQFIKYEFYCFIRNKITSDLGKQ